LYILVTWYVKYTRIVTKQNACSVTCKCACIPASQIHSIAYRSMAIKVWLPKYGYKRAKQFGEGGEPNVQNKVFSKKVFTKIIPFSHRISVKKGLHFQVFRNIFKIFRIRPDLSGLLPSGGGVVAPLLPSPTPMHRRYQISSFISIVCSYSGMKPQSWPILAHLSNAEKL